ncbi:hypothetical protein P261_00147 [Lachnospiraceae bacterium TWA4]|nr:hypothetical protein P261_00147 [Lachnospiraceae bacterium TWA4]
MKGKLSNEASTKLLIEKCNKQGESLDKIITICTDKVDSPINGETGYTHYDYYESEIKTFCTDKGYTFPKIIHSDKIKMENFPKDTEIISALSEVKKELNNSEGHVCVYIDGNGSMRYMMNMLITVIKLMEKTNSIEFCEVLSVDFYAGSDEHVVKDTKEIYDTIELISATDEIINYGKTSVLSKLFEKRLDSDANEDDGKIRNAITEITNFCNDLQLCRTNNIISYFYKDLNDNHKLLKEYLDPIETKSSNSKLFKFVKDVIEDEYSLLFKNREKREQKILDLIEWCLNKDFIQQALTFSSERLPEVLIQKEILGINKYLVPSIQYKHSINGTEYNLPYYIMNHYLNGSYKDLFELACIRQNTRTMFRPRLVKIFLL